MIKICRNYKRLSLWILLLHLILIIFYIFSKEDTDIVANDEKITFVESNIDEIFPATYHTLNSEAIFLKNVETHAQFIDFNSSICYVNGTDLASMRRSRDNWACKCLSGWHGKDCGQPEVIWRAFLTYRKSIKIQGPRAIARRLIYIFSYNKFSETIAEIRINELANIVDLFILYETDDYPKNNKLFKQHNERILYLPMKEIEKLWKYLRDDDIILHTNENEIPNKFALNFLKFYDKWPEPLRFRLRWSVFGFFWLHPAKTIITGGACSFAYFKQFFNKKISSLTNNKTLSKGLILGDLNHYGGWYCEYCYDLSQIIDYLNSNKRINLESINQKRIDGTFLEDIIENGLYIDGKTELIRTRRYHDNYFAPYYVMENNWKYDFLLVNFYSKIDYYEG